MHEPESEFVQLSRDGQSLGIYFMLTATRVNAVRQSLLNNLKTKVVHYLMDQSEGYSIYGRPKFNLEPIPGRVIIQKEELYFAQMFLPVDADDDIGMFNEPEIRRTETSRAICFNGAAGTDSDAA